MALQPKIVSPAGIDSIACTENEILDLFKIWSKIDSSIDFLINHMPVCEHMTDPLVLRIW